MELKRFLFSVSGFGDCCRCFHCGIGKIQNEDHTNEEIVELLEKYKQLCLEVYYHHIKGILNYIHCIGYSLPFNLLNECV